VTELQALFKAAGHVPAVIFLNWPAPVHPEIPLLDERLCRDIPLLVWRRLPEWTSGANTLMLEWLKRWLAEAEDPVLAFHEVIKSTVTSDIEAGTAAVHGNYRGWRTAAFERPVLEGTPKLRLNRDRQKALVGKHLRELVRSGSRRVMALAAYGEPGNAIEHFAEQLRDYLEDDLRHDAEIAWVNLSFPGDRSHLRSGLEHQLSLLLGAEANEPTPHLLRRRGPKAVAKRAVLWLNWGTFGAGGQHQDPLTNLQLQEWVRFSSLFLGTHCPDDLRIVSFAGLEVASSRHKPLSDALQRTRREPWSLLPTFRLTVLQPLGTVLEEDLLDFLEDPKNSSCDPGIHIEIAERLIADTGGRFEGTVALMEEGERGSWYDLLERLRRDQGAAKEKTEEVLF
jgi:hypothetical protein